MKVRTAGRAPLLDPPQPDSIVGVASRSSDIGDIERREHRKNFIEELACKPETQDVLQAYLMTLTQKIGGTQSVLGVHGAVCMTCQ